MSANKHWKVLGVASLLLATSLSAWAEANVIRIGVAGAGTGPRPVQGGAAISDVHLQGLLEKEFQKDGVKVEWNFFKGAGPAVNEALANRIIDFAWVGDLPSLIGESSGMKTKLILAQGLYSNVYLIVPADSPAKSIEDLKGKRIATFKGTKMQLAANKILEKRGLSERDFKTINMDTATAQAALATKDIDGAWLGMGAFKLAANGVGKIIYSTKNQPLAFTTQANLLVTQDFEKSSPKLVQRVVNVIVKQSAALASETNTNDTLTDWAKDGSPLASWQQEYEGTDWKQRASPVIDDFFVHFYKTSAQAALKYKLIRQPINVDKWIDKRYLQVALKANKLENFWPQLDAQGKPKTVKVAVR